MFSKANFALLFFFVLYLMKINNGMVFSSELGPALKAEAGFRRLSLAPEKGTAVHTMEKGLGRFHKTPSICSEFRQK